MAIICKENCEAISLTTSYSGLLVVLPTVTGWLLSVIMFFLNTTEPILVNHWSPMKAVAYLIEIICDRFWIELSVLGNADLKIDYFRNFFIIFPGFEVHIQYHIFNNKSNFFQWLSIYYTLCLNPWIQVDFLQLWWSFRCISSLSCCFTSFSFKYYGESKLTSSKQH